VKTARFVAATKELFYYISALTMIQRRCESLEEAERFIACTGIEQRLVVI
jgi:hypothetical protein